MVQPSTVLGVRAVRLSCVVIALATSAAATAQPAGETDISAGRTIAARGIEPGRPGCASCHMLDGAGQPDVGIPRLAGLSAAYIFDQLNFFASGRRINPAMAPYASMLSDGQRRQVAAYFASLPVLKPVDLQTFPAATLDAGRNLFLDGNFRSGLLPCANCHGQTGQGVGDFSPRLAGQSTAYVTEQLTAWRADNPRDPNGEFMHAEAAHLSKSDIAVVAAYVAALRSTTETRP